MKKNGTVLSSTRILALNAALRKGRDHAGQNWIWQEPGIDFSATGILLRNRF
jgi:hypothetical protein